MVYKRYWRFYRKNVGGRRTSKEFAKRVAEKSTSTVASILRGVANASGVGASVDRSWQHKGFTFLSVVITAKSIDNEKVLDTTILSKSCKGYTKMQTIEAIDPEACDKWNAAHKCGLNYKCSSLTMKTEGVQKICKHSVTKHNLYYNLLLCWWRLQPWKILQLRKILTVQKSL